MCEQETIEENSQKLGKISSMILKKAGKMKEPLYGSMNMIHCRIIEHETTLLL